MNVKLKLLSAEKEASFLLKEKHSNHHKNSKMVPGTKFANGAWHRGDGGGLAAFGSRRIPEMLLKWVVEEGE